MLFANYEYFLKIVEYKSISKAAEALFVSQPSLTKYLQRLESTVGATLFDRKQTPLKLTTAGEFFLEYVLKMQEEEKKLTKRIYEIKNSGRDRITIGMPLWRANVLLPEFLPYFSAKYPLIQVQLIEGAAEVIEDAIRNDKIDFGIMNLPVNYADVSYETLTEEYIFLVGSRENEIVKYALENSDFGCEHSDSSAFHPLLSHEDVPKHLLHADIHALCDQPFILNQPNQHITNYINSMLSRNNIELNCVFRTANVATAINLAAANLGFAFVPELGTRSQTFPMNRVALFTVDNPPLRCTLAAVYKKTKYLSNACRLFLNELKDFCVSFQ